MKLELCLDTRTSYLMAMFMRMESARDVWERVHTKVIHKLKISHRNYQLTFDCVIDHEIKKTKDVTVCKCAEP